MAIVSIVIPVYYNAASLPALAGRLNRLAAENLRHQFEFIYVDDGSGDDSFKVLQEIAADDPRVRVVKLARNFGSTTAVLAGISYASGDCVGFIAADLQDPPEAFTEMIRFWEGGSKVVLAMRKDRRGDPFSTRLFALIFNWLVQKLVFPRLSPQGIGFFLIDRVVADLLIQSKEKNAFIPGMLLWMGFEPAVVIYERAPRKHGASRWTFRKKFNYLIDAFAAFSYLPLRLCSLSGILLALAGAVYGLVIFISRLLNQIPVPGWSALAIILLLTSGVQLIMLGVMGEYLWRTLDAVRDRPLFVVDRIINPPAQLPGTRERIEKLLGSLSSSVQKRRRGSSQPPDARQES